MTESTTTEAAPDATTSADAGNLLASAASAPQTQAAAPAETNAAPASTPSEFWVKNDGTFSDGWQKNLPEDIRAEKTLQSFKDINSLARTVVHQQKMMGAEKIALPGKDAKPEDWNRVWDKLGRPATPDKYDLKDAPKLPDGAPYDYEGEKVFLKDFHDLGITQSQAKGLIARYRERVGGQLQSYEQTQATQRETAIAELRKEYGQAFDQKTAKAAQYVKAVAGDKAGEIIGKYGNDPAFIRFVVDASKSMQEDSVAIGESSGLSRALSPVEAQSEINEIKAEANRDKSHPLNGNRLHPRYNEVLTRWKQLHVWKTSR
jgi:hypothetical protein